MADVGETTEDEDEFGDIQDSLEEETPDEEWLPNAENAEESSDEDIEPSQMENEPDDDEIGTPLPIVLSQNRPRRNANIPKRFRQTKKPQKHGEKF